MQDIQSVSYAPAIINVEGKTKSERQLSVARAASSVAQLALVSAKGKLGQAARMGVTKGALDQVAKAAAMGNYRPIAEYLAAQLGEPLTITSRSTFESLPDQFDARIAKAKLAKNEGWVIDKKTGEQKPSAAHALALTLKADCVNVVAKAAQFAAESKVQREANLTAIEA